jgi:hypothetical protein
MKEDFFYERCEITATNAAMYGFASWLMFTCIIFVLQSNLTWIGFIAAMLVASLPSNFVAFWVGLVLWNAPTVVIKECYDSYEQGEVKIKLLYT